VLLPSALAYVSCRLIFFPFMHRPPPRPTLFPYTTLFRSRPGCEGFGPGRRGSVGERCSALITASIEALAIADQHGAEVVIVAGRSEEHTSELQSRENLVCRLLLEKKKTF